jgi:hypothetical protein
MSQKGAPRIELLKALVADGAHFAFRRVARRSESSTIA